jgi:hypothetical protein
MLLVLAFSMWACRSGQARKGFALLGPNGVDSKSTGLVPTQVRTSGQLRFGVRVHLRNFVP